MDNNLLEKYNTLIKMYNKNKLLLSRVVKRYSFLFKKYALLKKQSNKTVMELTERIIENNYQMIITPNRRIISISDQFLNEIEMTKEDFNQSIYIDIMFEKYLPEIDKTKEVIPIKPFHLPIMIKNYIINENEHIHPYMHFEFSGKIKYIASKKSYFYFLNIADITSEVELNYIQNTDSVIKSLSISNLYLQNAKKNIEVHKIMLIFLICSLIEEYNKETSIHLKRIQEITTVLSAECLKEGLINISDYDKNEYVKDINYTSVLHDIGKMGIPNYLLSKESSLTEEEKKIMSNHTIIGANYIKRIIDFLKEDNNYSTYIHFLIIPYEICLYHHERWDGKGYPEGLKGEEIPISARIVAVADTYDAIRASRSYNVPKTHEEAIEIIKKEAGKQFDPAIVKALINVQDKLKLIEY